MNRPLVLILGCLFIITLGFGPAGLALCMPTLAADLHLTYTQQGLLLSIGFWAFLVAMLSAGVADRAGFRGLLVLSAVVQASGWLLMGCATSFAWLCAAALATGIGSALADPLLTPMVCAVYPEQRARMSNVLHAGYALGLVFTSLLAMALLCGAGFVVAVLPLGAAGAAIGLGAVGFGVACFWPSLLALGGDRFPTGGASMFTGLTVAGGLGSGTAPAVIGWIADHTRGGLTTGLCLMAALPLVLFVIVMRMTGAHQATDRDGK